MHQAGLRNTVGLMGTALTDEQVGELARLAPTVLLALDADARRAGGDAARGARRGAAQPRRCASCRCRSGSDPADLVAAEGARAMAERVEASVPFVRFRVERELAGADLSRAEGKDAVIAALRPVFRDIPASAMREELIGLVADRTELAPALVASWLAQGAARRPRSRPAPAATARRSARRRGLSRRSTPRGAPSARSWLSAWRPRSAGRAALRGDGPRGRRSRAT